MSTIGSIPSIVFVTVDNSVFVTSSDLGVTVMWSSDSGLMPRNLSGHFNQAKGLFVSSNGDIYVDNGLLSHRVEAWKSNGTNSTNSWNVSGSCFALFLVNANTL
jgi:hypothetical protein